MLRRIRRPRRLNEDNDICSDIFNKILVVYEDGSKKCKKIFNNTTVISSILKCLNDEDLLWELLDTAMCNGIENYDKLYDFIDDNINDVTDVYINKIIADNEIIFNADNA